MTQTTDPSTEAPAQVDLTTAIQRVLAASPEPLTLPKIRSQLPRPTAASRWKSWAKP